MLSVARPMKFFQESSYKTNKMCRTRKYFINENSIEKERLTVHKYVEKRQKCSANVVSNKTCVKEIRNLRKKIL